MRSLADEMERWIKDLFDRAEERVVELRRSELANHFSCVPSQVTYVLTTRFIPERGYRVVSRRGAGGFIRIERLVGGKVLATLIEAVGDGLTAKDATRIIGHLRRGELISAETAGMLEILLQDGSLGLSGRMADEIRANMIRMLLGNI